MAGAVLLLCAGTAIAAPAQMFEPLADFDGGNGQWPYASLVQGRDGKLYGTTSAGGTADGGTVFRVAPTGHETVLYGFVGISNGYRPTTALVLATDGNFYGTTDEGNNPECPPDHCGTVFRINPKGILSTLHVFERTDGSFPSGLIEASDGNLYGTAQGGGNMFCTFPDYGCGTVFRITPSGVLTTLYQFCIEADCRDGAGPSGGLVEGPEGSFYGTTIEGGTSTNCFFGCGTVFKITREGALTTLHSFINSDGIEPVAGLIQGEDGDFYGSTSYGGADNLGTIFKITHEGLLTTLHNFYAFDGAEPLAALIQATDGNLYGTTYMGGLEGTYGTIFKMTPDGTITTLHEFDVTDGGGPNGLVQGTDGKLYGTAFAGGTFNDGTVFTLDVGLGPCVAFVRPAGEVGQTGGILGQGFTGTTGVSLNGIPASFTVVSDTFIKATVPAGATTGFVTVVTPSGTLTSNVPFHVIP